ncbi:MAG: DUF4013 domain-containing protein [Chloroflexota bacterium]|nr:DUF4013 domain-containing protein [Chloroflexota bacterium]
MDIGKSFTYMFEDPDWISKLAIGTAVLIISALLSPILIGVLGYFIVSGYGLDVLANVRGGDKTPMPAWKDKWGEWLIKGFKVWVATIVWALPAILLGIFIFFGGVIAGNEGGEAIGAVIMACFGCLSLLWALVVFVASPGIYIRLAETGELSEALHFGDIIEFTRDNLGEVLIAIIVTFLASMAVSLVAGMVGLLLCGIGVLILGPLAQLIIMLIQMHLYAQVGTGTLDMVEYEPDDLAPANDTLTTPLEPAPEAQ